MYINIYNLPGVMGVASCSLPDELDIVDILIHTTCTWDINVSLIGQKHHHTMFVWQLK